VRLLLDRSGENGGFSLTCALAIDGASQIDKASINLEVDLVGMLFDPGRR
jgi:hypothetical protein